MGGKNITASERDAPARDELEVGQRLYAPTGAVTLGKRGCLCYDRRTGFLEAPSLARRFSRSSSG